MKNKILGIVGLGYVGLPLAVEFGKKYPTVGFDINQVRVNELRNGNDRTLEVSKSDLKNVLVNTNDTLELGLLVTSDVKNLERCNVYIVTVPTPTDKNNHPILLPLQKASETIGRVLCKENYVIYESTVYPGATEDECVPILEESSGLKYNVDFFIGYSPERINPGDKLHTITNILKITSGSTPEAAEVIDQLYKSVILAGTFKASSIKVAEAAKVIENSQRDINIAFVNELSKIFNLLDIDTMEVLEAAGTKWNFLPFKPGLVGGHCIGVDPYYLAQKAQEVGYHPEIILAGRRLNDGMGKYIAREVIKLMITKGIVINECNILLLGFTFKENCPDIRNTRVIDIYRELETYGVKIDINDPWASKDEVWREFNLPIYNTIESKKYDAIILAVAHDIYKSVDIPELRMKKSIVYDVKSFLSMDLVDARL